MDKALQREKTRERVKRYRNRQTALQNREITGENVTPHSVYQCIMSRGGKVTPPLLDALTDKGKRHKLELIYESLKERHLESQLYYGVSGITFTDVGELLEATA